ncbi:MAG TPA: hypothetical protein VGK31_11260 [Thermoanaerobaculia bacterium]
MTNRLAAVNSGDFVRYLLGEVSDKERAELEQKYFSDDEVFEQLVDAQEDLVDAYLSGDLTPLRRKRFEERFLATESGSDSVKFAGALRQMIAARQTPPVRRARFEMRTLAIAASAAFVVFLAAWIIVSSSQRREPTTVARQAPPAAQKQATTGPAPQQAPASPLRETPVVTLLLTPGSTRDSDVVPPLELRAAPQFVRLELVLEDNRYDSYRAELQDVEGRRLWEEASLQPEPARTGKMIVMRVPAKLIPPGDYIVLLHGIRKGTAREISNYTFTVVARAARRS